jgi:hypothetical protein
LTVVRARRDFVAKGAAMLALGALGSAAFGQEKAGAPARAFDDPGIQNEMVSFKNGQDTVEGYMARPRTAARAKGRMMEFLKEQLK